MPKEQGQSRFKETEFSPVLSGWQERRYPSGRVI